jgi:hypothetical protein
VLGALARWGLDWTWSEPRAKERVNLDAVFRVTAAMPMPAGLSGVVELVVEDAAHDGGGCFTFQFSDGKLTLVERPAEHPDTRVIGGFEAWISALSPREDESTLKVTGDARLADALLAALAPAARAASSARAVA